MPFTHEQFLDAFAAYNTTLWPAVLLLWLATAGALVHWVRRGEAASRLLAGLLALHWGWSALAYHLAFFRPINPAASVFALFFLVQAALFLWLGVAWKRLRWRLDWSPAGVLGALLVVYGMVYPALGLLFGLHYPRMPVFGVPCPTTLVTAGILLTAAPGSPRWVALVPILWTAVAGSAAFTLGIRADLALIAAGLLLIVHVAAPRLLGVRKDEGSSEAAGRETSRGLKT